MTRADTMSPGKVQIVPRGRWKLCLYSDNENGTSDVLVGAKMYTIPTERIVPTKEKL